MSDECFNRQITVKYELDGNTINVKIDLDKERYSTALDAHRKVHGETKIFPWD
jgi:hypothetical protein